MEKEKCDLTKFIITNTMWGERIKKCRRRAKGQGIHRLKKLGKEGRQMQPENSLEKRTGVRHLDSEVSVKTSITNKWICEHENFSGTQFNWKQRNSENSEIAANPLKPQMSLIPQCSGMHGGWRQQVTSYATSNTRSWQLCDNCVGIHMVFHDEFCIWEV